MRVVVAIALSIGATVAAADDLSLRLGGKEIPVASPLRERLAGLAREIVQRCGPNTVQHGGNFGPFAEFAADRWERAMGRSRLHVVFGKPFETASHLGGRLAVSEALIGLEEESLFVGPDFTRNGNVVAEHLQCEYLPSLELACLAELAPYLPASYREACAKLERDPAGRIVMPPPFIAPSCS